MSIPIVDFSLPEGELAPEIDRICREIGFFVLVNHGVPQSVIDRLHALAVEFFDLPQAEKLKVARPKPELNRGFIASGSESLARLNGGGAGMAADYKEVFTIGPIDFPDDPYFTCPDAYPSFYPNLWPERPAGLRAAMTDYWRELGLVEARMMQIFALALGLPTDFFLKRIDKRTNHLRLIDYPPYTGQPLPGQLRAGVHTDLGMFGMVNQNNNIAGLEVMPSASFCASAARSLRRSTSQSSQI
jgi:isopenicillin N synthase-like dioxygenase